MQRPFPRPRGGVTRKTNGFISIRIINRKYVEGGMHHSAASSLFIFAAGLDPSLGVS
jgi:hypothetical protein